MSIIHQYMPTPTMLPTTALADDTWSTELVPQLPDLLTHQAQRLNAFQRIRGIDTPTTLLRALLAYVLGAASFRQLGAWAVLIGLADLSDTAWRKRLRNASAWLLWLVGDLLASPTPAALTPAARGRVLLVDATRLKHTGGTGDDWRLHTAYDLVVGRLSHLHITDCHTAEMLTLYDLQPGDIAVADNAYGYRRSIAHAVERQADTVLRITPATFPLETAAGTPLDVVAWLRKAGPNMRSRACWCQWQGQRYGLRLVALKKSAEATRAALRHKRKEARRDKRTLSATSVEWAGWVLLVTTLDGAVWSDEEVVALYRARWQIEVLYKRIKQVLGLRCLRARSVATAEATVRALLVAWAVQAEQAATVRALLVKVASAAGGVGAQAEREVSSWGVTVLCVATLRQQVMGQWTAARVRECLPRLARFLVLSPRRRVHQETALRQWLVAHPWTTADRYQRAA
jgi:hypothetical protein